MFDPVWFVSLGPGDPELITLKALKALQRADLVFCPGTKNRDGESVSRALDILSALEIESGKVRIFDVPMSADRSDTLEKYRITAQEIAEAYHSGKKIAVTAEGDAGFYSTIDYIAENLTDAHIPVSRIAGVPAFIACGALAGISITRQDEQLEVIPGTLSFSELSQKLEDKKTLVIMKASRCEEVLKQALSELADVDFHYFENAGVPGKEFYSCSKTEIGLRAFPYFSLLILQKK